MYPVIDMAATGKNIERLRRERHITVRQLQETFDFNTPQSIYRWQWGETLPDLANLLMLADIFHVSVEEIIVREKPKIQK
jgi:transcriptional regulator with XRE-family HTH domain